MIEQLEAKALALEAQAEELKRKAAEIREVGARLSALLSGGAESGSGAKLLPGPAAAPAGKPPKRGKAVPVARTFKCSKCKEVKDAAPRGAVPKVCKDCKEEAASKKQR